MKDHYNEVKKSSSPFTSHAAVMDKLKKLYNSQTTWLHSRLCCCVMDKLHSCIHLVHSKLCTHIRYYNKGQVERSHTLHTGSLRAACGLPWLTASLRGSSHICSAVCLVVVMEKLTFLFLSQEDVVSVGLTMAEAIELCSQSFREHSTGKIENPPKPGVHPQSNAFIHAMPGKGIAS